MPRLIGWLRRRELQVSLLGFVVASIFYGVTFLTNGPTQSVIASISASFTFASVLRLLQIGQDTLSNRKVARFFGGELTRQTTKFAYPDFVMHDDVRKTLSAHNQQLLYMRPDSSYLESRTHRVDLERAVAGNDVQALLYVADVFDSTPGCPNIMLVDTAIVQNCDCSFISFGLSSNDCTHLYMDESDAPLFEIVPDGSGSEYLRLIDGAEFRSTSDREFGLLVRYSPNPSAFPHRRWFLVGGLGPHGTTGAAWYLAHNWQTLARHVQPDQDFAAIVSCNPATDRTGKLVTLVTVDLGSVRTGTSRNGKK